MKIRIAFILLTLSHSLSAQSAIETAEAAKQRIVQGLKAAAPVFVSRGASSSTVSPEVRGGYVPRGPRPVLEAPATAGARKTGLETAAPAGVAEMEHREVRVDSALKASFADLHFEKNSARYADATAVANVQGIATGLLELLKEHPRQRFLIEGHTCDLGTEDYNAHLSWYRAEAVRLTLVGLGVPAENLEILGCGKLEAKALEALPKDLEEPRKPYRKVVLRVIVAE